MHPKNSLFWANIFKKTKKPKKPQKNKKKKKKQETHWAGFFLNPGFFQPRKQTFKKPC
jgi:hypothetical protein